MTDEHQNTQDSPDNSAAPLPEAPAKQGSSVLKLAGIVVALTLVAALIVGFMFWKTLNDSQSRPNVLIEASANPNMQDEAYEEDAAGAEEVEVEGEAEPETPAESEATPEPSSAE
jgi:hypothetical protein